MRYNHQDFASNPAKYRLFKTAITVGHLFTHNGESDLPGSSVVSIQYAGDRPNRLAGGRLEPFYEVNGGTHYLLGSNLQDFCL